MRFNPRRHGITSRANPASETIREAWDAADRLNAELPPGTEWSWAPSSSVFLDRKVHPRLSGVDPQLAAEYADIFDRLSPIVVQRGSFTLIDGFHRLGSARLLSRDLVRIAELDVEDGDLTVKAFEANAWHGRPLTQNDRRRFARLLREKYPTMPVAGIAERAGISPATAAKYLESDEPVSFVDVVRGSKVVERPQKYIRRKPASSLPAAVANDDADARIVVDALREIAAIENTEDWVRANAAHVGTLRKLLPEVLRTLDELSLWYQAHREAAAHG